MRRDKTYWVQVCNWMLLIFAVQVLITLFFHGNTWWALVGYWGTNVVRNYIIAKG